MPGDSWLASLDAWKLASPEDYERQGCDCGEEDCEECLRRDVREALRDSYIDQQIDERKEGER